MSVIHASPPEGSGVMPCCGKTMTEVPLTDRVTVKPEKVTCRVLPPHELLTPLEVADILRVSNMTVYREIHSGNLPAVKVARQYRVRREDLEAYLHARVVGRKSDATRV